MRINVSRLVTSPSNALKKKKKEAGGVLKNLCNKKNKTSFKNFELSCSLRQTEAE